MNFRETREIIHYAKKYISGRTLDLGAGSAKYREIIKEKTSDYVTFDMAPGPNIDVVGDALNLPFGGDSFETIVCTQVLEHVEKPWLVVKEIHRVLKSGGICFLTAPFMEPYHPYPGDYFRYSVDGIKSLFRNEGFQIIECGSYGPPFTLFAKFLKFGGLRALLPLARILDRLIKTKNFYADVYIVAKK